MSDATATAAAPAVEKTDDAAAIIEPTQTATTPADDAGAKRTRAAVVKAGETAKRASAATSAGAKVAAEACSKGAKATGEACSKAAAATNAKARKGAAATKVAVSAANERTKLALEAARTLPMSFGEKMVWTLGGIAVVGTIIALAVA